MHSSRKPISPQPGTGQFTYMRAVQPPPEDISAPKDKALELVATYEGRLPKYVQEATVQCDGCGKQGVLFGFHVPVQNQDYCQDCAHSLDTEGWIAFHPRPKHPRPERPYAKMAR